MTSYKFKMYTAERSIHRSQPPWTQKIVCGETRWPRKLSAHSKRRRSRKWRSMFDLPCLSLIWIGTSWVKVQMASWVQVRIIC